MDLHIEEYVDLGKDNGKGNLLGIEPYLLATDYATAAAFEAKLGGYLEEAQKKGWLNEKTVVIYPEYIGAWLAFNGERESALKAPTLKRAMLTLVFDHLLTFLWYFITSKEKGRLEAALFRTRVQAIVDGYNSTFSNLARKYKVTIVGASTVLPAPQVVDGRVVAGKGLLYNISALFGPDGRAYPALTHKVYPTKSELPFTQPAPVTDLPAYDTPAGKLATLICADSWFPDCYAQLKKLGVEIIAVPSGGGDPKEWTAPWGGYDGWPPPKDVDTGDIGVLTEGQAWKKYALAGRIHESNARYGSNVFTRGQLWDQELGAGRATLIDRNQLLREKMLPGATIINLWL